MKYKKTIQVPAEFIFDKVIEGSLYDIKKATGQSPTVAMLPHFTYEKAYGPQKATISFNEVTRPTVYDFSTTTRTNHFTTRWEFQKAGGRETLVTIAENAGSVSLMQYGADSLTRFFFSHRKKVQLSKMLGQMEEEYRKVENKKKGV